MSKRQERGHFNRPPNETWDNLTFKVNNHDEIQPTALNRNHKPILINKCQ